jgi:hypothetical protein
MGNNDFLTVDDLITAFIDEARFGNDDSYHKQKLEILKELFDCDLEKRQEELDEIQRQKPIPDDNQSAEKYYEVSGRDTIWFLERCSRALPQINSPFAVSYLEGMPPKIVRDLQSKYERKFGYHEARLNSLNHQLIKEVLKYLFPGIERKKIPAAKLYEMGLPQPQAQSDPDDDW